MQNMSKKNGASSPREGTASAVREAVRSGDPERATSPEGPKRRVFTAEYKLRIVREADAALASGGENLVGALLRREGLYSSHIVEWRRARDAGALAGLSVPRGRRRRDPQAERIARLEAEKRRLEQELAKARFVVEVQAKLHALLETISESEAPEPESRP